MDVIWQTVFIGVGATLIMDAWAVIQKRVWNIPPLDYRLVGRWVGCFFQKKLIHKTIIQTSQVKGEVIIGWFLHYLIGIVFSFLMIWVVGYKWLLNPTFFPALIAGIISVIAPFFIMQPCFGFGIAASLTPKPNSARFRSLIAHVSFGVGLYISAELLCLI
ncbi:DUF2938 domain-containing protein [Entomomonas moraniae]|uniref:DUF2938 domain-containing protein n=1 Tax=Entomomonas moraniae TaxID=2213226 RepID=A0A3Q9JKB8_9GAMM|nr:DUF2938 domain-containing protein [Entomomonas moraniae]AZS49454.1 DUF2938 domain-containing protein [Entomomonas moraniae]